MRNAVAPSATKVFPVARDDDLDRALLRAGLPPSRQLAAVPGVRPSSSVSAGRNDPLGGLGELVVADKGAEARQGHGRHRARRRRHPVVTLTGPHDERLGVVAGRVEPAASSSAKSREQLRGRRVTASHRPAGIARELAEAGAAVDEPGVVGRVAGPARLRPGTRSAAPSRPRGAGAASRKVAISVAASAQSSLPGGGRGLGEGRAHHGVPLGDDLVVEAGADPAGPGRAGARPWRVSISGGRSRSPRRARCSTVRPSKLPSGVTPYHSRRRLGPRAGPSTAVSSLGRPEVVAALLAFGVGVLGRVQAAGRVAKVAQHVGERLVEHLQRSGHRRRAARRAGRHGR